MPPVAFSPAAIRDLDRLRNFLRPKNPVAAKRAAEAVLKAVQALTTHPNIGRLVEDMPEQYREWLADFGDSGYVIRYRIDEKTLTILAVRHQREAGF